MGNFASLNFFENLNCFKIETNLKFFTEDEKFFIQESWKKILLETPNLEALVPRVLSKNSSIQLPNLFEKFGFEISKFFKNFLI